MYPDRSSPKYIEIIREVQRRIERGAYPAGGLLPSEAAFAREFGASRSTVVRALEFLRDRGWVEARQGKGRIALGPPQQTGSVVPDRVRSMLTASEHAGGTLLAVRVAAATHAVASALDLAVGTQVVVRRLLVGSDGDAAGLRTAYVPMPLAATAGMASREPLRDGLLAHLRRHRVTTPTRVVERISARPATEREARLLGVARRDCLLAAVWSVQDHDGRALFAVDAVFAASRRALRDAYSLI